MTAWMHILVSLVGGGILIGVGLAKARAVSPPAGYLFAAAGGLIPAAACCTSAAVMAGEDAPDPSLVFNLATLLGTGADLIATIIIIAAFVVLSRARSASAAP